ncbi:MAG: helix-turn-helix transcriptional regulator [Candidatus Riflebacteria bacterium]|nr:helix-turn-helix transcriptional regulator [Candidatus Riflebacteria bacterium]
MAALGQAFARNLVFHRSRLGLSRAGLAREIGRSPSHVRLLERGEREPDLGTLEALSAALGVPVGELFVDRADDDSRDRSTEELLELLRARPDGDLRLLIRLAHAVFDASPRNETGPDSPRARRPRSEPTTGAEHRGRRNRRPTGDSP